MITRKSRALNWAARGLALVPIALTVVLIAGAVAGPVAESDPRDEPFPVLEPRGSTKVLVVRLDFVGRTDVEVEHVEVAFGRAPARSASPPLLEVQVFDDDGTSLETFNAWHPLWSFGVDPDGTESRRIEERASGSFIFPFRSDLGSMEVSDVALGARVAEVDLKPAIRTFCEEHPDDDDCLVADLAVVSLAAVTPPPFLLLGEQTTLTVRTVVTNQGPDAPMDAVLTRTASASAGATIAPAVLTGTLPGLSLNEQRIADQAYTVVCTQPGIHTFNFSSTVSLPPVPAAATDPVSSNDTRQASVTLDCAVPITINIKPGGDPNAINLKGKNDIPVAVLTTVAGQYGTPVSFDATRIDALTVRFGARSLVAAGLGGAQETHKVGHIEDAYELDEKTKDGDLDMVLHFQPSKTGLTTSDTEACIKGQYIDAAGNRRTFFGCGPVVVIK